MVLNREEIEKLIKENNLIEGFINLEKQITPNGFDLTAASIAEFVGSGALDFSNQERVLAPEKIIKPLKRNIDDKFGWWNLKNGSYKITPNEICTLPKDLLGIAFPRSSLLRMGAFTQTGVWDAGFSGKSEFILVVKNKNGIKLKQNARIVQLVFMRINETKQGYAGIYQKRRK